MDPWTIGTGLWSSVFKITSVAVENTAFWYVAPWHLLDECQRCGETSLPVYSILKIEATFSSDASVLYLTYTASVAKYRSSKATVM